MLLLFIDGLHATHVAAYVSTHPRSALASLGRNGLTYDAGQGLKDSTLTKLGSQLKAQTLANAPAIRSAILRMTATPQTLLDPATLPLDPRSCVPVYPPTTICG